MSSNGKVMINLASGSLADPERVTVAARFPARQGNDVIQRRGGCLGSGHMSQVIGPS